MTDIFTHGKGIPCPECPRIERRKGKGPSFGPMLIVMERNYSGCSVDYGQCEECGKAWCICYIVDSIERAPDWDGLNRQERKVIEEANTQEKEEEDRKLYLRLKERFEPEQLKERKSDD